MSTTTEITTRVCPGYGEDGPHELEATEENFYRASGGGWRGRCKPHYDAAQKDYDDRKRPDEGKGVYLGVLKMADGSFLTKVGRTGDKNQGFRTRAGAMAKDARWAHGIDTVWAEIIWVIDIKTAEARKTMEEWLLAKAEPVHGKEYFRGIDYLEFLMAFLDRGRFFERRTTAARRDEFYAWLDNAMQEEL